MDLKTIYAGHFYEAATWHGIRVKQLGETALKEYNEGNTMTCFHAASCLEMFVAARMIESNPQNTLLPTRLNREKSIASIESLQSNDINRMDIAALSSMQLVGIRDLFKKFIKEERLQHENPQSIEIVNSLEKHGLMLLEERNSIVHRNLLQRQSFDSLLMFSHIVSYIQSLYGSESPELACFQGKYKRQIPALTELLNVYLASSSYQEVENIGLAYHKAIIKIINLERSLRTDKRFPNPSLSASIIACPRCGEYAFITERTEALYTYWTGEPNNSSSVLTSGNPSGESEYELFCPICTLHWDDTVLSIYNAASSIEYRQQHLKPNQLTEALHRLMQAQER